jgi:hypothetical protein
VAKREVVSPVEQCTKELLHTHTGLGRLVYNHGKFANNHIPNLMDIYEEHYYKGISTLANTCTNTGKKLCYEDSIQCSHNTREQWHDTI